MPGFFVSSFKGSQEDSAHHVTSLHIHAHIFPFEDGGIHLSEAVREIQAEDLGVTDAPGILYKQGGRGISAATAGPEDIIDT